MKTALIRLGPTISHAILSSDAEPRTLYEDVQMLSFLRTPPVCIDHDATREIGEVLDLFTMQDTALHPLVPVTPWLCARVRLHDHAPGWIKRGSGASISTKAGFKSDRFGWPVSSHPILHEVTICSAATVPIEPLARVLHIQDEAKLTPAPTPAQAPARRARTKAQREFAELHRRIDAALEIDPNVDVGKIITNLKAELGYDRRWWHELAA